MSNVDGQKHRKDDIRVAVFPTLYVLNITGRRETMPGSHCTIFSFIGFIQVTLHNVKSVKKKQNEKTNLQLNFMKVTLCHIIRRSLLLC